MAVRGRGSPPLPRRGPLALSLGAARGQRRGWRTLIGAPRRRLLRPPARRPAAAAGAASGVLWPAAARALPVVVAVGAGASAFAGRGAPMGLHGGRTARHRPGGGSAATGVCDDADVWQAGGVPVRRMPSADALLARSTRRGGHCGTGLPMGWPRRGPLAGPAFSERPRARRAARTGALPWRDASPRRLALGDNARVCARLACWKGRMRTGRGGSSCRRPMLLALTRGLLLVQEARIPHGGSLVRRARRRPLRVGCRGLCAGWPLGPPTPREAPAGGGAAHVLHLLWTLPLGVPGVFVVYAPPMCAAVGGGGAAAHACAAEGDGYAQAALSRPWRL